ISLLRILRNLVDNALKYGGVQLTAIAIGHKETEKHHVISVWDNGVGLEKEESKSIFRAFKRKKTSVGICGTGLGLAIVKEIAEQHKGEVWVEHGLKKGIAFCFSISKFL
ncbi:MAG: sensor histidine kinase, partial [Desulfobulbaceae bacterium]|nr:sensor histidine kinase [Desulfobulbaceae bacterium]